MTSPDLIGGIYLYCFWPNFKATLTFGQIPSTFTGRNTHILEDAGQRRGARGGRPSRARNLFFFVCPSPNTPPSPFRLSILISDGVVMTSLDY